MADPANDSQAVRPEVVLLLLDTAHAAGDIDDGPACHAGGRLLDPGELALIHSRTSAEERAVTALIDAGWQRWHRRSEALAKITAIIGEAPPLAQASFDAAVWAYAVPRDWPPLRPGNTPHGSMPAPRSQPGRPGRRAAAVITAPPERPPRPCRCSQRKPMQAVC
ncbi:MAG TPA: hypothetical protein VEH31_27015 [Streptosporangiaceae bacterium]|nr:hypothetical protein [Streptosporangiaceae bacterium]